MKNNLATVQAIAMQTLRGTVEGVDHSARTVTTTARSSQARARVRIVAL